MLQGKTYFGFRPIKKFIDDSPRRKLYFLVATLIIFLIGFLVIEQFSPNVLKVSTSSTPSPTPTLKLGLGMTAKEMQKEMQATAEWTARLETSTDECMEWFLKSPIKRVNQGEPTGTIEGSLSFPSEGFPKGFVTCAFDVKKKIRYCTPNWLEGKQFTYGRGFSLNVPEGFYYVSYQNSDTFSPPYVQLYGEMDWIQNEKTDGRTNVLRPYMINVEKNKTIPEIDPDATSMYILCEDTD